MQAYRIVNWWRFELLKNGKLATVKTKMVSIRKSPLIYVRFPVHGHTLSADYRRMVKRAGKDLAPACYGLYKMLVELAGNQVREYRGWVLDDRQNPLINPGQVAELLCLSEKKVSEIFEVLLDREVKLVEFLDFPESLCKSIDRSDLAAVPKSGDAGKNWEKKGEPFIETETEYKDKDKRFETKRNEGVGVREKTGEQIAECAEGAEGGKENVETQAHPASPASVSVPDTDSAPVPVSEQLSDSVSVPVSDSVSVPTPGTRDGLESICSEPLSDDRIFEIRRDCKGATLELTQIIHPHNTSDITTIHDIYTQLQNRMIAGSPYPLYEMSLNTARQCWRGDKPIAVFVSAMKKPPFHYVPKRLSVIPGKFPRTNKNTNDR